MNTPEKEIPVPGKVRCVNENGEVGYANEEFANNRHWQRSTGFKPKPLPVAEPLPELLPQGHLNTEVNPDAATVETPAPAKTRKTKNT